MTVKNLNLALPMELYTALKRDADLVAAPTTTHIRGILMRYIRSTDEAVQARKAEVMASTRPVGAQQQALADYDVLCTNLPTDDDALHEFMQALSVLRARAGNNMNDKLRIPKALTDLGLVGVGNSPDGRWRFASRPVELAPSISLEDERAKFESGQADADFAAELATMNK